MRVCRCSFRSPLALLKLHDTRLVRRLSLIYQTFYYNHDSSVDLRIDTVLQPLFFLTDRLAKYLGRLFICLFLAIISVVVYIFYTSIFVHLFAAVHTEHSYWTFLSHVVVSHWLLVNIMFNYIQCTRVDPGSSPNFGYVKPYDFDKANRDLLKRHQADIDKNNNNNNRQNEAIILSLPDTGKTLTHPARRRPLSAKHLPSSLDVDAVFLLRRYR